MNKPLTFENDALMATDLPLAGRRGGKVRDIYDLDLGHGTAALLIVATDRISAFDVIMGNGIPGKGQLLTRMSRFWFDFFGSDIEHHLLSDDAADIPGIDEATRAGLAGRIMICHKTRVVPVECIVRGYITGSGWKDYEATGSVCGIPLAAGLENSSQLPEPLFTPSTKAESGHDQNISFDEAAATVGAPLMARIRDLSLQIYDRAREHALARGIIIADTKFEFGMLGEEPAPLLIDEVLTPDSSRFWPADDWAPGREQDSFDKQIVRNYLEALAADGQWGKQPPGPLLPREVIDRTLARYEAAVERLSGDA